MNPFKSKIRCKHCGKNYRSKTEKGVRKFICGGYHNKTGCTKRIVIQEEFIRELLNKRFDRVLTDEEIANIVDYIEIEDKLHLAIIFTDGSLPIVIKPNYIHF